MLKIFKYFVLISLYVFTVNSALAEDKPGDNTATRDPFSPVSGEIIKKIIDKSDGSSGTDTTANPLTTSKINTLKVVGVMISEKKKVAAVKAINGLTYVVEEGANIGSDNGKVSEINFDGMIVSSEDGKVLIPVSNKIEVKLEKKD